MFCLVCKGQARRTACPACHGADVAAAVGDMNRDDWKAHDRAAGVRSLIHAADPALAEAYWPEGHPPMLTPHPREASVAAQLDPDRKFLADVAAEVTKARAAFPGNGSLITGLALGEESGEAQRALLHIYEGKRPDADLWLECVQTAAMALRLATELADRVDWPGNAKRGCGGSYEVGSGGHVPGVAGEGCAQCDRDFAPGNVVETEGERSATTAPALTQSRAPVQSSEHEHSEIMDAVTGHSDRQR